MDAHQDHQQPCTVSHYDSARNKLNYANYFELPPECQAGENKNRAVITTKAHQHKSEHMTLEEAINKILKFRTHGVPSEEDMSHIHVPTNNNKVKLLINGHNAYPEIIEAINNAKHHIHMTYFKFVADNIGTQIIDALVKKAQSGVKVRFMLDEIGSGSLFHGDYQTVIEQLIVNGVEVITNPATQFDFSRKTWIFPKDHRKVVIIDGKVGFTGGMNVADPYVFSYHDTMVKLEGHVVHQLQVEWLQSWLNRNGDLDPHIQDHEIIKDNYFPVLQDFPGFIKIKVAQGHPDHNDEIRREFIKFINTASEKLYIQVPFFSIQEIFESLVNKAKEGVDVRLIVPEEQLNSFTHTLKILNQSWYPKLIEAGVRVYEHPGFSHLKGAVKDGETVMWGSSNLDGFSLYINRELNIIVDNPYFAELIEHEIFIKDMAKSKEITNPNNGWWLYFVGGILNFFSDYM